MTALDDTATLHLSDGGSLAETLRQMVAVLQEERQALSSLDADGLSGSARRKEELCNVLAPVQPDMLDAETRGLAETARRLNEVNRQVRNLLAANVAKRLEALGGSRSTYSHVGVARG